MRPSRVLPTESPLSAATRWLAARKPVPHMPKRICSRDVWRSLRPRNGRATEAVEQVERFWQLLGSKVVRMSPKDHDRSVAAISHMPHLVASALAAATPAEELQLASTGWLDTTRIASGDPELWRQILVENRGGVLKSLDKFEKVLASFRRALERDEPGKAPSTAGSRKATP